jgi:hypothetical protein
VIPKHDERDLFLQASILTHRYGIKGRTPNNKLKITIRAWRYFVQSNDAKIDWCIGTAWLDSGSA